MYRPSGVKEGVSAPKKRSLGDRTGSCDTMATNRPDANS
jgi:hypothetical protein